MTDQILSSLDPFGTESDKEFERVPISLTRSLIVARVGSSGPTGILSMKKWTECETRTVKVIYSCQDNHRNKYDGHCSRKLLGTKEY